MIVVLVSLCVREWIETQKSQKNFQLPTVSLCVREWIETQITIFVHIGIACLPLREGVD